MADSYKLDKREAPWANPPPALQDGEVWHRSIFPVVPSKPPVLTDTEVDALTYRSTSIEHRGWATPSDMMDDVLPVILLLAAGVVAILLATRWWFWAAIFVVGGLAAVFSMLASIIHFQILGALAFTALAVGCWFGLGLTMMISEQASRKS